RVEQCDREAVKLAVRGLRNNLIRHLNARIRADPAGDVLTELLPLPRLRSRKHLDARERHRRLLDPAQNGTPGVATVRYLGFILIAIKFFNPVGKMSRSSASFGTQAHRHLYRGWRLED